MATLKELKLKQLQETASKCGLLKSGTKAQLYQRIRAAGRDFVPLPPKPRILSIDMGIRNMAFCLLEPRRHTPKPSSENNFNPISRPSLHISTWKRLALDVRSSGGHDSSTTTTETETETETEDFSPSQMAKMALHFLKSQILPLDPTHILIERQRYRTSSAPAITNWTIRVNSLEAMLYSMLAVYQSLGKFKGEVIPVTPKTVATFLLDEDPFTAGLIRQGMTARQQKEKIETSKKNKVNLLGRLVRHKNEVLSFQGAEVERIAAAFADHGRKKKKGEEGDGGVKVERIVKVDDLADCLLQGLAWLRWHRNLEDLMEAEDWVLDPQAADTSGLVEESECDEVDLEEENESRNGGKRRPRKDEDEVTRAILKDRR